MTTTAEVFSRVHSRGLSHKQTIEVPVEFNARRKFKSAVKAVIAQKRFRGSLAHSAKLEEGSESSEKSTCSTAEYSESYATFLKDHPEYAAHEESFLEMRAKEYGRLDEHGHVYVDYTGGCLYPISLVENHAKLLQEHVLGNPHSTNPTSLEATHLVEATRYAILKYVNADPEVYTAVFTLNATGALKLIAEAFPFSNGSTYLLSADNHNSVGGIREPAVRKGARVFYAPLDTSDLRMKEDELDRLLSMPLTPGTENLFAFPGQSNFSGVKHPLSLVAKAKAKGWTVLLDTAAYLPTNVLDLSTVPVDFCTVSFYKIFGYPTGVGALIARKDALDKLRLHRPWFSGGVVSVANANPPRYIFAPYEAAFEEGTVAYTQIPAVAAGLEFMKRVGVEVVQHRVMALVDYLLKELTSLQHSNGKRVVTIIGPANCEERGGTVAIAVWDRNGAWVLPTKVEEVANAHNISLRIGCFCNPGCGEAAFSLTTLSGPSFSMAYEKFSTTGHGSEMVRDADGAFVLKSSPSTSSKSSNKKGWWSRFSCTSDSSRADAYTADNKQYLTSDQPLPRFDFAMTVLHEYGRPFAGVRISLGIASTFRDVHAVLAFMKTWIDWEDSVSSTPLTLSTSESSSSQ